MDDPLLQDQKPAEYFKDQVESALTRQQIRASELTLTILSTCCAVSCGPTARSPSTTTPSEPLALRLGRALE